MADVSCPSEKSRRVEVDSSWLPVYGGKLVIESSGENAPYCQRWGICLKCVGMLPACVCIARLIHGLDRLTNGLDWLLILFFM